MKERRSSVVGFHPEVTQMSGRDEVANVDPGVSAYYWAQKLVESLVESTESYLCHVYRVFRELIDRFLDLVW